MGIVSSVCSAGSEYLWGTWSGNHCVTQALYALFIVEAREARSSQSLHSSCQGTCRMMPVPACSVWCDPVGGRMACWKLVTRCIATLDPSRNPYSSPHPQLTTLHPIPTPFPRAVFFFIDIQIDYFCSLMRDSVAELTLAITGYLFFFLFSFFFLQLHTWHIEVPRPEVKSQLHMHPMLPFVAMLDP